VIINVIIVMLLYWHLILSAHVVSPQNVLRLFISWRRHREKIVMLYGYIQVIFHNTEHKTLK